MRIEHTPAGELRIWHEDMLLLQHSAAQSFVSLVRKEKTYQTNRGTVKEIVREIERVALNTLSVEGNTLHFSAEGHTLTLCCAEREGGVEFTLQGEAGCGYVFTLPAVDGEAVYGGGEQYRQSNLRGEKIVNFVAEHIKASTILEKALLPRKAYRERRADEIGSYAPMPCFVTSCGRAFGFDTDADGYSKFGDDHYSFSFDRCPKRLALLHAHDFRTLAGYLGSDFENRQYLPDWCFDGMILGIQGGCEEVLRKTNAMLDAGAAISAVWSQDWCGENRTIMGKQVWWNWEQDEKLYADMENMIAQLRARGVRFLGYINPYLVKDGRLYNECKEKGFLITHTDGSIYHIKSTTFDAGMLDLTNPAAVEYTKEVLIKQNMLAKGISGWMADFGEYLPVDCVLHDGDPHELHNLWPVLWAKLNREAIDEFGDKDAFFFNRSGYLGVQSYAPIMWNGDQHTDLTRDYGMPCVMPASFSLGFSGVTLVHCDIGGFFSFGKLKRDGELFTRWMEMCSFSMLMRSHESIRPWANAQFDAPGVTEHTVRLTNIHRKLKPYLLHVMAQAQSGIPAMRPDFYESMVQGAGHDEYSYYLGDDLFVCPVIERKATSREVFLPEGEWIGFWDGIEYKKGAHRVSAPLGKTPVFYRKGSAYAALFREAAEG